MRAARFSTLGSPEVLTIDEVDAPVAGPGEVRIRVKAAAIQPFDRRVRTGNLALPPGMSLPVITGNEFAGIIDAVGPQTEGFAPGDEVAGRRTFGAVADYVVVPASDVALKPASLSFAQAATLSGTAQTADTAVESLGIGPGDTLLILGAAGGVGSFATQLAVIAGARVFGTGSAGNQDYLQSLGAQPLLADADFADARPTAILDCVGGAVLDRALALGVPTSRIATLAEMGRVKELGLRPIEGVRDGRRLARLLALAAEGRLIATVRQIYPIDQIVAAHRDLDTGHGRGKIVIAID